MTTAETIAVFEKYVIPNYTRYPIVFVKGAGSELWDADGKRYIDLFPGWAVDGLGHCPPRVVKAVQEQVARLMHIANNYYTEPQGQLAREIAETSFGGQSFFCNSGAEANESAIKCARLWGADASPKKYKIITMQNSFHGRTMGSISATGQPKYHKGIEPVLDGFAYVPFNDLDAVKNAVDEETVAVLVEPVQGEGGINIATQDYMKGLRSLCDERGLLLMLDEVQTGMGRTGEWYGYQHYDIVPDIITLAKSLGGGAAIGALVGGKDVVAALRPGTHASTFGGNCLASAAALATFETIREENLIEHARAIGEHLGGRLNAMKEKFPFIKEVRRLGLMSCIDLDRPGSDLVRTCIDRGVLLNCTHETVVRVVPATNAKKGLLDEGLDILEAVLAEQG